MPQGSPISEQSTLTSAAWRVCLFLSRTRGGRSNGDGVKRGGYFWVGFWLRFVAIDVSIVVFLSISSISHVISLYQCVNGGIQVLFLCWC